MNEATAPRGGLGLTPMVAYAMLALRDGLGDIRAMPGQGAPGHQRPCYRPHDLQGDSPVNARFATFSLPLLLAACSPGPSAPDTGALPATPASSRAFPARAPAATQDADTALGGYHWQLKNATDAGGQRIDALFAGADRPLQLDVVEGRIAISNGCNRMSASYQANADAIQVGPMTATRRACIDPALGALDEAISSRLAGRLSMAIKGTSRASPMLTLHTVGGDTLIFVGRPTAETRFGGPGETVFLEVAPGAVSCAHPPAPASQCLRVRERHYDAKGLSAGEPGRWRTLDRPIEGYTHAEGVREVLRVQRYTLRSPAVNAPPAAYILDGVVESGGAVH